MEELSQLKSNYPFLVRGLVAVTLLSIINGFIGSWVHTKRIQHMASSLSHSLFAPITIAVLVTRVTSVPPFLQTHLPLLFSYIFAAIIAIFMWENLNKGNSSESFFSFLWAIGMSIGISVMVNTPGYATDLHLYLFGDLFLISGLEIKTLAILAVCCIVLGALYYNEIKLTIFERRFAKTKGIKVQKIELLATLLTALTIVTIVKAMGIILLLTVMAFPSATAAINTKHLHTLVIGTMAITFVTLIPATVVAYHNEILLSPLSVFICLTFYLVSMLVGKLRAA